MHPVKSATEKIMESKLRLAAAVEELETYLDDLSDSEETTSAARPLTISEVLDHKHYISDAYPVFLETKNDSGSSVNPAIIAWPWHTDKRQLIVIRKDYPYRTILFTEEYNQTWRCWDSNPTHEAMRANPWDDSKNPNETLASFYEELIKILKG